MFVFDSRIVQHTTNTGGDQYNIIGKLTLNMSTSNKEAEAGMNTMFVPVKFFTIFTLVLPCLCNTPTKF
jgi:hypothetical protein